ncbi:PtdIns(3,5)P(2) sythesis regulation factor [Balamuthia mandrillaris]
MLQVVKGKSAKADSAPPPPITPTTLRNLNDKLYEKRKLGALEVEQLVKQSVENKDVETINNVIAYLTNDLTNSPTANMRKGGLIALAATALGLGSETWRYLNKLVPPVLKCFRDQDSRVRYYACESMYNIAKVARGRILSYFNDIFDGLCRLSADPDLNVKNGSQLLDRLVKDIITESDSFDIERFIPLLQDRINVMNSFVRQFLLSWITVLDSVPDIEMLDYLPDFLEGLFKMLSDPSQDIRREADNVLGEFLKEIQTAAHVEFGKMVSILIPFCSSQDEFTRLTALKWIKEFIQCGKEELLPFSAELLGGVLPSISDRVKEISELAVETNKELLDLIHTTSQEFAIGEFLDTVTYQFLNQSVPTRLAALKWVLMLHAKTPEKLVSFLDGLYPALLKLLSDSAEQVVRLDLEVLAKLSSNETYFEKLMDNLIHLFSTDNLLLETRGCLIIRQLGLHINPEKIFRTLAHLLQREEDPEFSSTMIQTLNLILLTSTEVFELRQHLKDLTCRESQDLFAVLYQSWCHNAVATLSLCLLAQAYEHATDLIFKFAEMEITVTMLMEIDKLIQLLESPIFIYLRLQLLEPERFPFLYKCLYGLLMLLPQSTAFNTLKNRLESEIHQAHQRQANKEKALARSKPPKSTAQQTSKEGHNPKSSSPALRSATANSNGSNTPPSRTPRKPSGPAGGAISGIFRA